MGKQVDRTAETKKALVDAFCLLCRDKPFEKITVKQITDLAGFYRSTFYIYFNSIYDVLDYIEEQVGHNWGDIFDTNMEDFSEILMYAVDFYNTNLDYLSVLLKAPRDSNVIENLKSDLRVRIFPLLNFEDDDLRFIFLSEFMFCGLLGMLAEWLKRGKPIAVEELVSPLLGLFGQRLYNEFFVGLPKD